MSATSFMRRESGTPWLDMSVPHIFWAAYPERGRFQLANVLSGSPVAQAAVYTPPEPVIVTCWEGQSPHLQVTASAFFASRPCRPSVLGTVDLGARSF